MSSDRGGPRPTNWGRWGTEDQRGALNLLTPELVRRGAAAVSTGRTYPLGIPIQAQGIPLLEHRGRPMRLTLQDSTDEGTFGAFGCQPGTGAHEDLVVVASHTGSHMDALIHVYEDFHHYNGVPSSAMRALSGATRLGIEHVGAFAARAVLLDVARQLGPAEGLEPGRPVSGRDLEATARAQGVEVGPGDVVLVRTGYLERWFKEGEAVGWQQAGLDLDGASWLAERDVVAVGADNAAVEAIPFDGGDFLAVHKLLLVRFGIYLLEFLDLSAPSSDRCYEGLITVAPLKVTGATGSPVNPVLIG